MTDESTGLNVFVTGADSAAGWAAVRRLLAAGHTVTGVVADTESANALRKEGGVPAFPSLTRSGEILSNLKAVGADTIVHLAPLSAAHVPQVPADWEGAVTLLRDGTSALLEAAQAAEIKTIVFGSYAFVYGNTGSEPADESAAPASSGSPVIDAALKAEQEILNSSIPATVLRVGYWYDAHCPHTLALRDALKAGRPTADSDGAANWIHVDDLTRALMAALEKGGSGEIYNLVDDDPASVTDFGTHFAGMMNLRETKMPAFLQRLRINPLQNDLIGLSTRASNAKAKDALGWKLQYPSHQMGLEQVLMILRAEEPVY